MGDDLPFRPPFGVPAGPSLSTSELLSAYLAGAQAGSSPEAHIEPPMLMASDHPVAVRVDSAVLVREEPPVVARAVHAALCRMLEAAGMVLVEGSSVLAGAVAMELAVPRGYEWSLWARDGEQARADLVRLALRETGGVVDVDMGPPRADSDIDAVLDQIEREW